MKKMRMASLALGAAGMLALVGCSTQLGQFDVYAPDGLDLSKPQYVVDKSQKVCGADRASIYLLFPENVPSYDQAVKNAMAQKKGCVGLSDITLRRASFWFLFGYCDFIAEGYPIMKKPEAAKKGGRK